MNLKHLVYFRELAHTQHMSKAAENLGISQPTLSYSIDNLEKQLGVPLFEHEGRNIRLSSFGKIYLKFVSSGLDEIERGNAILKQLLNVNQGIIKMGFTDTLGQHLIPELVASFKKKDETRDITFELFQGTTSELLDGLIKEKYDFVLSSKLPEVGNLSSKSKLDFLPIIKQEIMLAVPKNHPLAKYDAVEVKQISDYPFIAFSKNSTFRPLIDQILKNADVTPNTKFEIEEDHTMMGFVEFNQGIALIPNMAQVDNSKVKLIHLTDNDLEQKLYMVIKDNRFLPPSVSRFQNFLARYCKENYKNKHRLL